MVVLDPPALIEYKRSATVDQLATWLLRTLPEGGLRKMARRDQTRHPGGRPQWSGNRYHSSLEARNEILQGYRDTHQALKDAGYREPIEVTRAAVARTINIPRGTLYW